jgi:hypothetical protein
LRPEFTDPVADPPAIFKAVAVVSDAGTSRDREGAGKLWSPFHVIDAWNERFSDHCKCLCLSGLDLTRCLTVAARE